jgi:hypothetical protein
MPLPSNLHAALEDFIAREKLPADYAHTVETWFVPLAEDVLGLVSRSTRAPIIGTPPRAKRATRPINIERLDTRPTSWKNEVWKTTLEVQRTDLDDDQTGNLNQRIEGEMAKAYAYEYWAEMIDRMNTGASTDAYTGSSFFDTDHVWGASGVMNNNITATQVPTLLMANPGEVLQPPPEKAVRAILGSIAHMRTFRDNYGRPLHARAMAFDVWCNTNKMESFYTAITANDLSGGQTNPLAQLVASGKMQINIVDDPDLFANNTAQFAITRTDAPGRKPFGWSELDTPEYTVLGPDSDHGVINDASLFNVRGRWGMGNLDALCALLATLSS